MQQGRLAPTTGRTPVFFKQGNARRSLCAVDFQTLILRISVATFRPLFSIFCALFRFSYTPTYLLPPTQLGHSLRKRPGVPPSQRISQIETHRIRSELSTLNCKLPPLTALFPPLTNRLSVSPLLATLARTRGQRAGVLCFPVSCVCTDSVALLAPRAPSSQRNPLDFGYNLRFALLALGPASEVSR